MARRPLPSTVEGLKRAQAACATLDGIIERYHLSMSKGSLSRAMRGLPISLHIEQEICEKLTLPRPYYEVAACPICGGPPHLKVCRQRRSRPDRTAIPVGRFVRDRLDREKRRLDCTWDDLFERYLTFVLDDD